MKLQDSDGTEVEWSPNTLSNSRSSDLSTNLAPGQEMKFRSIVQVPKDMTLKAFTIRQQEGRSFSYDFSSVK